MRCWYFWRTLGSGKRRLTVASSMRTSQPWAAQAMVPIPSDIILVVRYSAQHGRQKRWPHSRPDIDTAGSDVRQICRTSTTPQPSITTRISAGLAASVAVLSHPALSYRIVSFSFSGFFPVFLLVSYATTEKTKLILVTTTFSRTTRNPK